MKKQWIIIEREVYPGEGDYDPEVFTECAWGPYDHEEAANLALKFLYGATDRFHEFIIVELKGPQANTPLKKPRP